MTHIFELVCYLNDPICIFYSLLTQWPEEFLSEWPHFFNWYILNDPISTGILNDPVSANFHFIW